MIAALVAAGDPGLVAAFGGGMLSFVSPCVLPLVPAYLSLMSGVGTSDIVGGVDLDVRRVARATVLFVAGFTAVFVALGAAASSLGELLTGHQRALNRVAGVLVMGMAVLLAGVVSPRVLQQERRLHVSPSRLGPYAAPLMGAAFAFGWTPCIGPILGAVLSLAAARGTVGRGAVLLFAYSLGLGVPFIAAGIGFGRLASLFGWFKRHAAQVNLVSGLLLFAFGLVLFLDRVGWLSARLVDLMTRVGLERLTNI